MGNSPSTERRMCDEINSSRVPSTCIPANATEQNMKGLQNPEIRLFEPREGQRPPGEPQPGTAEATCSASQPATRVSRRDVAMAMFARFFVSDRFHLRFKAREQDIAKQMPPQRTSVAGLHEREPRANTNLAFSFVACRAQAIMHPRSRSAVAAACVACITHG